MDLLTYGFSPAGEWVIRDTLKSGISFKLSTFGSDRVVYAFVVNTQHKYIGICEKGTTTLADRMSRYKNQQGAGTNERISIKILQLIREGNSVQIFALRPREDHPYKDLNVDLVKGLENPLIEKFRPEWNRSK